MASTEAFVVGGTRRRLVEGSRHAHGRVYGARCEGCSSGRGGARGEAHDVHDGGGGTQRGVEERRSHRIA
jgi:hypothetical protein